MAKGSIILGNALVGLVGALTWPVPRRARLKILAQAADRLAPVARLPTPAGDLRFVCRTRAAARRPHTLFTQEPETKRWLDGHVGPGEVVWDVGANIGQVALYAARVRGARVVAFEPSAQTFGLLYGNVAANAAGEAVAAYCIALARETALDRFYLKDAAGGAAMHALGHAASMRGAFQPHFVQAVLACRGDDFVARFGAPAPDHLKIDVDGTEHDVLAGLTGQLGRVRTLLLEWTHPATSPASAEMAGLLAAAGLDAVPDFAAAGGLNRLYVRRSPAPRSGPPGRVEP